MILNIISTEKQQPTQTFVESSENDMTKTRIRPLTLVFGLTLMALPASRLEALSAGRCPFVAEGFADRRYQPDGSLVPRSRPDAFVADPAEAVRQAEWLLREKGVQTLCVHGDNPHALAFVYEQ